MTTNETLNTETSTQTPETPTRARKRAGRKRTVFHKAPRPAWPVKGLWESAPEEAKREAHRTCMAILEYWLGKKDKAQVAAELEVTGLRVWQLSQKALSGMMAGLLKQPRTKVSAEVFERRTGESAMSLKHRIVQLEKELARTEDLVRVLRMAPWANSGTESPPKGGKKRGKRSPSKSKKKRPARRANADRSPAPGAQALEGGGGSPGDGGRP